MWHRFCFAVACMCVVAAALAGAPPEAEVQGMYEGTWKTAAGQGKLVARVVALGKNTYKVFAIQHLDGGKTAKVEMDGKLEGEQVVFQGKEWSATYADAALAGKIGADGTLEAKRTTPKSPAAGKKPPKGAIVLLDGKNFDQMVRGRGQKWYLGDMSKDGWAVWEVPIRTIVAKQPAQWPDKANVVPEGWTLAKDRRRVDTVIGIGEDGSIRIPRGGMNAKRQVEGSFNLHVEFLCPFLPTARSQGRANSGVYLPCGQEIQVLDSFGMTTYKGGGCGGLYRYKDPDVFAHFPPGTWQTFDIEYVEQKPDAKGKKKVRVTVLQNGLKIHDNVQLRRDARKGPFRLQDHGNPVQFRNIWLLPLEEK